MSDELQTVDLWVDPACPWCWLTSRWLVEVERVRPVRIAWRLFDLAEINRDHDDARLAASHSAGERALRVLVAARRTGGEEAVARLYAEMGEAWHERAEPLGDVETLERCLAAAGLPAGMASEALEDDSTLEELLAEHNQACDDGAFGVPTLRLEGSAAWFGPILDVRVGGEEAGRLWDAAVPLLRAGHFFELKRERTGKADVGRYRMAQVAAG